MQPPLVVQLIESSAGDARHASASFWRLLIRSLDSDAIDHDEAARLIWIAERYTRSFPSRATVYRQVERWRTALNNGSTSGQAPL